MSKEAMKLALEAFKTVNSWNEGGFNKTKQAIKALEEALAKQEQGEPVALKVYRGELCYKSQADDQSFGMWCPVTKDLPFTEGTKLYTTPQQRTWVKLDEEDDIDWEEGGSLRDLVEAVEAKLREKNT